MQQFVIINKSDKFLNYFNVHKKGYFCLSITNSLYVTKKFIMFIAIQDFIIGFSYVYFEEPTKINDTAQFQAYLLSFFCLYKIWISRYQVIPKKSKTQSYNQKCKNNALSFYQHFWFYSITSFLISFLDFIVSVSYRDGLSNSLLLAQFDKSYYQNLEFLYALFTIKITFYQLFIAFCYLQQIIQEINEDNETKYGDIEVQFTQKETLTIEQSIRIDFLSNKMSESQKQEYLNKKKQIQQQFLLEQIEKSKNKKSLNDTVGDSNFSLQKKDEILGFEETFQKQREQYRDQDEEEEKNDNYLNIFSKKQASSIDKDDN